MKSFCGFCALLMLAILCFDVVMGVSLGRMVFHSFLFVGNVICMNIDD